MAWYKSTTGLLPLQSDRVNTLRAIFASLDDEALVTHLKQHRHMGRHGYPVRAMFRAYLASFVLNLRHTNDLIRRLQDDRNLRRICGLGNTLPHRTTFNRFIRTLGRHADLVEEVLNSITGELRELIPDLGAEVAVDSTAVRTHANPHPRRRGLFDPEASWTAKNSAHAPEGKEWHYGYKLHLLADTVHGIPLAQIVTTAKRNDSPYLPRLADKARAQLPWLDMKALMADRGYDAFSNHQYLVDKAILPVILMKRAPNTKNGLIGGIYTAEGVPTCVGQVPMQFIRTDPEKGHLYRCRGCHLADSTKGMTTHCQDEVWEEPSTNIKVVGVLSRASPEWKALYAKRWCIERVFKSMKQGRRLEAHCVKGLAHITLHSLMSTLAYSATALVKARAGSRRTMRWMVEKVA